MLSLDQVTYLEVVSNEKPVVHLPLVTEPLATLLTLRSPSAP